MDPTSNSWLPPATPAVGPYPTAARGEAELSSPDYSFGGPLRYQHYADEVDEGGEPREVDRAMLNATEGIHQLSVSGHVSLSADFEVQRMAIVNVSCRS